MAPTKYYGQKELTKIGLEGFAIVDEFYSGGWKGKKLSHYGCATYKVTSRPPFPPPPPPPATSIIAINHSSASSCGNSRRLHHSYNCRYSPPESIVCCTPVVAMTTETTTVIRGYEAAKLPDREILMDSYKY